MFSLLLLQFCINALNDFHFRIVEYRRIKMGLPSLILLVLGAIGALGYMPHVKEHYISDVLLREMVDRMEKDLAAAAETYLDVPDNNR